MTVVQERDTGLRHGAIGMADALASTLSNMAPVEGIFIVLVIVASTMGSLTPWAFMLGAVGIALTGWNVAQLARRARIVLLAADGTGTNEIVRRTGASKPTVILWKRRYAAGGIGGLGDRPKPGMHALPARES